MHRSAAPAHLSALLSLAESITRDALDARDPLILDFVFAKVRDADYLDNESFHNAVFAALRELRRELHDQIAFDWRSTREREQLLRLTCDNTVAIVKRLLKRRIMAERL